MTPRNAERPALVYLKASSICVGAPRGPSANLVSSTEDRRKRGTTILTRTLPQFKIPPVIEEAWNRLSRGGGTDSDLKSVLSFLARAWAYDESDPRAFSEWRANHGSEEKNSPIAALADERHRFEHEQRAKRVVTRLLLDGLTVGPHASEFFASLLGSSELKVLAYTTAVAVYRDEAVLFALAALSRENKWVVEQVLKAFPDSPVFRTFTAYLNGARVPLAFMAGRPVPALEGEVPIDRLFSVATMPLKDMAEDVRRATSEYRSTLGLAERVLSRVPDKDFGHFARLNVCVFACVAGVGSRCFDEAKRMLTSTGEPGAADVLRLVGKDQILSALRDDEQLQLRGRERFVAALIDGLRLCCAGDSGYEKDVQQFASSPTPVVALAARAALAQRSKADRTRFESLLLRTLQQKDERALEWLSRNPELVSCVRVDKVSVQALKKLLDTCRTSAPNLAVEIIAQVLCNSSAKEPQQYWDEAVRALSAINRTDADRVFSRFMLHSVQHGEAQRIHSLVSREPASSLFRRNFRSLLDRTTKEQEWKILFDLYGNRTIGSEISSLLEWSTERNARLGAWISSTLVPELLEREALPAYFHRSISNRVVVVEIAKELARDAVKSIERIQSLARAWNPTWSSTKEKLQSRVETGVRIALHNAPPGSTLHSQLSRLNEVVKDWGTAESPKLEPSIESFAITRIPAALVPNAETVQEIFQNPAPGPSDFTLFAGANPWVLDLTFGQDSGPWPKPELLLDQIATTFVRIAQSRERMEEQSRNLPNAVRIELALALREILSDIESTLAGYFIFRDVLDRDGLHPVMERLGVVVDQKDLSSEKHKFVRDPGRRGRPRVFGLGVSVNDRAVGSGLIMTSGDDHDRD